MVEKLFCVALFAYYYRAVSCLALARFPVRYCRLSRVFASWALVHSVKSETLANYLVALWQIDICG